MSRKKSLRSVPSWAWLAIGAIFAVALLVGVAEATSTTYYVNNTTAMPDTQAVTGWHHLAYIRFFGGTFNDVVGRATWATYGSWATADGTFGEGALFMKDNTPFAVYTNNLPYLADYPIAFITSFIAGDTLNTNLPDVNGLGFMKWSSKTLPNDTINSTGISFGLTGGAASSAKAFGLFPAANGALKYFVSPAQAYFYRERTCRNVLGVIDPKSLDNGAIWRCEDDSTTMVQYPVSVPAWSTTGLTHLQIGRIKANSNVNNFILNYVIVLMKNTSDTITSTDAANLTAYNRYLRTKIPTGSSTLPFRSLGMVEYRTTNIDASRYGYHYYKGASAAAYPTLSDTLTINLAEGTYNPITIDSMGTATAGGTTKSGVTFRNKVVTLQRTPTLKTDALVKIRGKITLQNDDPISLKNLVLANPSDTLIVNSQTPVVNNIFNNLSLDTSAVGISVADNNIIEVYNSIFSPSVVTNTAALPTLNAFYSVCSDVNKGDLGISTGSVISESIQWRTDGTYRLLSGSVARKLGSLTYGYRDAGAIQYTGGIGVAGWGTQAWGTGAWGTQAWGTRKW